MTSPAGRQVPATAMWRAARGTIGPMACIELDPTMPHDHAECIRDDESYAADLIMGLLAAVVKRDEDTALTALTTLLDAVKPADGQQPAT